MQSEQIIIYAIEDLSPSVENAQIYGDSDDVDAITELSNNILKHGLKRPLIVDQHLKIIAGHRRVKALKLAGIPTAPCIVRTYKSDAERRLDLILDNNGRIKTNEQRIREGKALEIIEVSLADLRKAGEDAGTPGTTRDAVGKKIGMSGKTYETGKKVVEAIDKEPDPEKKERIKKELNKSVSGAKKALHGGPVAKQINGKQALCNAAVMLNRAYNQLSKERTGSTPNAYAHFIGNLQDMKVWIDTWIYDAQMTECQKCRGVGTVNGVACDNCWNGKHGKYVESLN